MTPEQVDEWAGWVRSCNISEFQEEGRLCSSVLVLIRDAETGDPEIKPMTPVRQDGTTESLDVFVNNVRDTCVKLKAFGVCFFSQMQLRLVRAQEKRDGLVFSYERAGLSQIWVAPIDGNQVGPYTPTDSVLIPEGLGNLLNHPMLH